MRFVSFVVALFLLVAWASAVRAQLLGVREADIVIEHPPGIPVAAETVLLLEPLDQCEEELARTLAALFLEAGVQVVDGSRVSTLLSEHMASPLGPGDPATLMAAAKSLGPSALIEVRSRVCEIEGDRSEQTRLSHREVRTVTGRTTSGSRSTDGELEEEGETEATESVTTVEVRVVDRVARTDARLTLSIRVFDLVNDRVYGERSFSSSASLQELLTLEHPWGEAWPEAPPPEDVVEVAIRYVTEDVRRLLFPWSEQKTVWFYNNDKCDLEDAYRALRAGSLNRALELSVQNLETCRRDPRVKKRVLGNAYQNLGMAQAFVGSYEEALANLHEAAALRPGRIVSEAIADVETALDEQKARRRLHERTESVRDAWGTLADRLESEEGAVEGVESDEVLGNADIVEMVRAGLPDVVILARIENATTSFSLRTEDLKALDEAGVGASVIVAMIAAEGQD